MDELGWAELKLPEVKSRDGLGFGVRLDTTREGRSLCRTSSIQSAWRRYARSRACRIGGWGSWWRSYGKRKKAATSGERYVGLGSVVSGTGELGRDAESAEGASFCFEKGDVLYGRLRPYLNKVWLASFEGLCSTEFHVLRTKDPEALRPEYLAVVMRTGLIVKQTKHMMTGNTHPRIANRDVENLLVPLADAAVQQRIVSEVLGRQAEGGAASAGGSRGVARWTGRLLGCAGLGSAP